jgi:hypothetical protein
MKYELGVYIPEDSILHSDRNGNLKSYLIVLISTLLSRSAVLMSLYERQE